jgi:hypothetical protein
MIESNQKKNSNQQTRFSAGIISPREYSWHLARKFFMSLDLVSRAMDSFQYEGVVHHAGFQFASNENFSKACATNRVSLVV